MSTGSSLITMTGESACLFLRWDSVGAGDEVVVVVLADSARVLGDGGDEDDTTGAFVTTSEELLVTICPLLKFFLTERGRI